MIDFSRMAGIAARAGAVAIALGVALPASPAPADGGTNVPVLRVFNWEDYIDLDAAAPTNLPLAERSPSLREFARKFGCRIEYIEGADSDDINNKIVNLPGFFDVVVVSTEDARTLILGGRTADLPGEAVPNLRHILPRYGRPAGTPVATNCAAYLFGITGLAYRRDLTGRPLKGWRDYFEPDAAWKGRLGLMNSSYEMFYAALKHLGFSLTTTNAADLRAAAASLQRLKDGGYFGLSTTDMRELAAGLTAGDIVMAPMYSTDALAAVAEDPEHLAFVVPAEGAENYVDYWIVLKDAPHRDLAFKFVNFMLDPDVHAGVSAYLHAGCPSAAAVERLRTRAPELLADPAIYPPPDLATRLETPQANLQGIHPLWLRIMDPAAKPSPSP